MIDITFAFEDGTQMSIGAEIGDTLMNAAVAAGVPGIIAECGGGAICGTCHVHIAPAWQSVTGTPLLHEEDTLDTVAHLDASSRLACQIVVTEAMQGLTVTVPGVLARRKTG